ncbi:SSCRP protein [Trichoderma guizhouense]|uniref:SSCRP protein n=1 Tax=Trichoderma guizhouense TaxID=1491466 RepID=A0A1T3CKN7_9HYPO|nr:SSCRP protein [Trichoderma guizhouense]
MAIRTTSLLLTILYVTGLVLSAPTARDGSSPLAAITKHTQAASKRDSPADPKKHRIFRVDKALWEKFSKTNQPTKYFLDATLELLETSQNTEVVPVFPSDDKGKSVIVDTNGDLMASYGSDKFVPVWSREKKHHGFHRHRAFGQRFALFILGFSLALALVCSCMRNLYRPADDSEEQEPEPSTVEKGLDSKKQES